MEQNQRPGRERAMKNYADLVKRLTPKSKMGQGRHPVPAEILSVGDIVEVEVYGIDLERGKVQLELIRD